MPSGARIALVASAHGYGHAARQTAVAEALQSLGAAPVIACAVPPAVVHDYVSVPVLPLRADVGLVQRDALSTDLPATRAALDEVCCDPAIDTLAALLADGRFDLVAVDIAPTALEACRRAGLRCVAVGNFDWAFIYAQEPALADWSRRFAAMQAPHHALELWPGPGLRGFAQVEAVGLVGRARPPRRVAPAPAVLAGFGGLGLGGVDRVLPEIPSMTWITAPPLPELRRSDVVRVEHGYASLIAGCDAVLTKPGYGMYSECALAGTPCLVFPRTDFAEAESLLAAHADRGDILLRTDPGSAPTEAAAEIAEALPALLRRPRPRPADPTGALRLARRLIELATA